jgi:Bacterial PH domain
MPVDRGVIDQQLEALGEGSRWWDQREMRDLPTVLGDDEQIIAISRGKVGRGRWVRRLWLIVVTDRRLVCVRSLRRTGWRQLEASAGHVTRVALRIGPFRGRVLVATDGQLYRLLVSKADARKIAGALTSVAPAPGAGERTTPALMLRRVFDHVMALPAVALSPVEAARPLPPPADAFAVDERVSTLEREVEDLRRHVEFLEDLLRRRQGARDVMEGEPPV